MLISSTGLKMKNSLLSKEATASFAAARSIPLFFFTCGNCRTFSKSISVKAVPALFASSALSSCDIRWPNSCEKDVKGISRNKVAIIFVNFINYHLSFVLNAVHLRRRRRPGVEHQHSCSSPLYGYLLNETVNIIIVLNIGIHIDLCSSFPVVLCGRQGVNICFSHKTEGVGKCNDRMAFIPYGRRITGNKFHGHGYLVSQSR